VIGTGRTKISSSHILTTLVTRQIETNVTPFKTVLGLEICVFSSSELKFRSKFHVCNKFFNSLVKYKFS
jgi:hypothetical protein